MQVAAAFHVLEREFRIKDSGLLVMDATQRPKDAAPLSNVLPLHTGNPVLVAAKKKHGKLTARIVTPPEVLAALGYPADTMNLSMMSLSTALGAASSLPCAPAVIVAGFVCAELSDERSVLVS